MEPEFWHERWAQNRIGFHEGQPNDLLVACFDQLSLPPSSRVFVPLAGKSVDIGWLARQGHPVVGIELNESAVQAFFDEAHLSPTMSSVGGLTRYQAGAIELFVGDVFSLTAEVLGPVDAVYDRAALIALPKDTRPRYAAHVSALTGVVPQLLVTLDYDPSQTQGPPFSVNGDEIEAHYGEHYRLTRVASRPITGPIAERCSGAEEAWALVPESDRHEGLE